MNIGDRISELLNQNGMNAKELAEKVGATPSTIYSLIQRGSSRIDVNLLIKIADVLHTSADAIIKGEDYSIDSRSARKGIRIPVLGRVAAGIPIEAIENIIDYEEIPEQLAKGGEFFGLQIKGDSMSPRIQEGDVVIVRKQEYAEDGEIVIAMVNGDEACCKRLRKYQGGIQLISFNSAYEPMVFTDEEVQKKAG